jgi:multiple sugar transport system substrate-binding protein
MDQAGYRATDRRQFLRATGGAATGMAAWLALGRAPAYAQKRELTFLSWNHFVPASDDELRKQAEAFGKQAGVSVRVDTIAHLQLDAKFAAEAQSQSGHDMIRTHNVVPFLYEHLLADVGDVVDKLGKQFGGWYPFAAEAHETRGGWRGVPWFWISFPATYNEVHFKKAGFKETPKTWDELLKMGRTLKKQGNPVGIPISHCADANTTFWSIQWSYGGKVLEPDGKTPGINSDKTAQVIEYYKELYKDAMEPEVLSWDDASNNRFILSGKGSWIHNPISPYNAALAKKMPIADEINHHTSPGGPAGIHSAPPILGLGIWKFSKNVELAKEFIQFLFRKENYDAWIVASNAFNHPPLKHLADHPIWAKNPKFAMLPGEAQYAHPRGWPAKPNPAVQLIDSNYILPDMVAKAINGMPTKRAMAWAQDQIALAVQGKLKAAG